MSFRHAAVGVLALTMLGVGGDLRPARAAATWPLDALPIGKVVALRGDLDALVGDLAATMPQRGSGL